MTRLQVRTRGAAEILDEIAYQWGVTVGEMKGHGRGQALDRAKSDAYAALQAELKWSLRRIGLFMGGKSGAAIKNVLDNRRSAPEDPAMEADILRRRLDQIAGLQIVHHIADTLSMNRAHAILLSVLIENYPRCLSLTSMCDLYDHARVELEGGEIRFINEDTIRSHISKTRKSLNDQGYPEPIVTVGNCSYILGRDFAFWCKANLGKPVAVLVGVNQAS